ncbi:hypothetical protein [Sanguibacter suaedae]|uniref:Uncharacterized protein n=1 Tax=Sanguibacter suaedae TaxID=2795737 RepID=A0A934I2P4_9MICO|nr:hypothetical protein [Sanguibacter suaedae]MBI9114484.1 hypothetical protein [Sanguibacter suaedae]
MTQVVVFSGYARSDRAALRLPVTLYNTGAKPLVVIDLRLKLVSAGVPVLAPTKQFRTTIMPRPDDTEDFPHPFVVGGRAVATKFVEFDVDPRVLCTGEPAQINLMVLVDRRGWRSTGSSEIRTDIMASPEAYISYSNDPAHWPAGQKERASAALASVRSGIPS